MDIPKRFVTYIVIIGLLAPSLASAQTVIKSYYDESGNRFLYKSPSATEIQVTDDYILRNGVPEITIKLGDTVIGTVVGTTTYGVITDQLGTPVKQVAPNGTVAESVQYAPFGGITSQTGSINTKAGYTGHDEDIETGLIYAKARYYNPAIGRFISQDPSSIYLGRQDFKNLIGVDRNAILADPQQLNSYSYVRNNPINLTDENGKIIDTVFDVGFIGYDIYNLTNAYSRGENTKEHWTALGLDFGGALIPGVTGLGFMAGHLDDVSKVAKVSKDALQIYKETNSAGQALMKGVKNEKVLNLIRDNYRAGAKIGSGSTADAILHTARTNELISDSTHIEKARNTLNRIENVFKQYGSQLNSQEKKVLNKISADLKNTLKKIDIK